MRGGDVFSLQAILGHSSLAMVRRYVNLAAADIATQHRKFSPVDNLGIGRREQILQHRKEAQIQTINRRRDYNRDLRELVNAT